MPTTYNRSLIMLVVLMMIFATFFFAENQKINRLIKAEKERVEDVRLEKEALSYALRNINIEAKAISIYDATIGENIYGYNDDIILPLASLAKTMTALVALEEGFDREVTISKDALDTVGDYGLFLHERWSIVDLVKLVLISSSNDGAFALAEQIESFLERMNSKAKKIGLQNTTFLNSTGLDTKDEDKNLFGAFGTAKEANTLALYALEQYPEIFANTSLPRISVKSKSDFTHDVENTNVILDKIPNILFSKTGFTDKAGGNLTVIFKNEKGHNIAVTLLGSSINGRFYDMENIINVLYAQ